VVLGNVGNRLERLEQNCESFAMSRVAAVEHHDRLAVVIDVAVYILSSTHLRHRSRDTNHITTSYLGSAAEHVAWLKTINNFHETVSFEFYL